MKIGRQKGPVNTETNKSAGSFQTLLFGVAFRAKDQLLLGVQYM
jgi:hypothetical protein